MAGGAFSPMALGVKNVLDLLGKPLDHLLLLLVHVNHNVELIDDVIDLPLKSSIGVDV
jgi:hypothetical protein